MGSVTTSACRVSALVLCAGAGVALTGTGGTAFVAAMAGSAFGGAAGNFFHQMVDGVLSWFGGRKFGTTALPANHDLDGLTASAIKLVLEAARDNLSTDDTKRGVLERLASTPVATIVAVMQAEDKRLVGDTEIVGTLGAPAGGQTTAIATPEYWRAFVAALSKKTGAAESPSALNTPVRDLADVYTLSVRAIKEATRRTLRWNVIPPDADLTARAKDPGADAAAAFAAGLLHAHVAAFANDILREAFGPQGRFFVAALFNMLNTISANTRQPPPGATFSAEQIAQIKACLPDAVNAAIAQSRALPAPADADSLAAARDVQAQAAALATTLQGMDAKLDAVQKTLHDFAAEQRETLARIEGKLDAAVANSAEARDAAVRVEKMLAGTLSAATLKATNNLAAAKIAPNQFFTGRTDELARLHAALAGGSVAIVHALTGEGGIGKTELAKVYALIYADTYDSVWWLDASGAALRGELVKVYERATGQQAPPSAHTDDLCQALVDHWKDTRPLVILDNVDDPATFTIFSALAAARILATTRQHHKTLQGVEPFALGVLPIPDAVALMRKEIAKSRADVTDADLTAIATELGGHALAVALAGAYLANYPDVPAARSTTTTRGVLDRLRVSGVGDIQPAIDGGEHDALGLSYQRSVAASLSLHFASEKVKPALPVLAAAAFLHPTGITVEWLAKGTGQSEDAVRTALKTLHTYSIVKYDKTVSLHRLTQGVARSRADVAGGEAGAAVLEHLLGALIDLFRWPGTQAEELLDHTKTPARLAAVAHAEAVIVYAEMAARGAGEGAAAPLPRTPTPQAESEAARLRAEMAHRLMITGQLADAARHIDAAIRWGEAQSPRDERRLAIRYASRASIRQTRGLLKEAEEDIKKAIDWEEAQAQPNQRELAIRYASRASIRKDRGLLREAEEDLQKSIDWGESQSPRDERSLAIDYASRAGIRQHRGLLKEAEEDIKKSIDWGEAQSPRDERGLAICHALRAGIRKDRGHLKEAEEDIKKSIDWGESQSPRDERTLAIWYALRARIREAQAIAARTAGDVKGAAALFAKAKADIAAALAWWEANMPHDERGLAILRQEQARIDQADRGE